MVEEEVLVEGQIWKGMSGWLETEGLEYEGELTQLITGVIGQERGLVVNALNRNVGIKKVFFQWRGRNR